MSRAGESYDRLKATRDSNRLRRDQTCGGWDICASVRFAVSSTIPCVFLAPYLSEGMTVLEPGPGMGFFTLELARIVGSSGRVIAVDVQPKMIEALRRRAAKANLSGKIDAHVVRLDSMQLDEVANIDFVLAFAVVHEMPDAATFFSEAAKAMKPGARMLLAEPSAHVSVQEFDAELEMASWARLEKGRGSRQFVEAGRRFCESPPS